MKVMMMVSITLVDIVGYLYFWDITIDIVSCINIVISVGLCVDYSVHIGHCFVVSPGTRLERTITSLENIGPAVFNGGLTTFLALVFCGASTSHTFITFFKVQTGQVSGHSNVHHCQVFVLTVVFGVYHGLVLLPVLLSLLGPHQHSDHHSDHHSDPHSDPHNTEEVQSPQRV